MTARRRDTANAYFGAIASIVSTVVPRGLNVDYHAAIERAVMDGKGLQGVLDAVCGALSEHRDEPDCRKALVLMEYVLRLVCAGASHAAEL